MLIIYNPFYICDSIQFVSNIYLSALFLNQACIKRILLAFPKEELLAMLMKYIVVL